MKKLISMMLMLCAIVTFSACSSSDDDGPTNPVSNVTVPSSAKIGSEVLLQGSGFAAGQTLYLQPESGNSVDVNAKMSSNGATFTVPYTMSEGKVSVVLKNGGDTWTLGSMTLLAADNPISALALPSEMALGSEVTIAGLGFADGDKILLRATSRMQVEKDESIAATVTTDGLKFTVPAALAEGNYTVTLVRGKSSWSLGEAYAYQAKRIKTITLEGTQMMMLGMESATLSFSYNEDGTLAAISSPEGLAWTFTYNGNKVTTTSVLTDKPLEFTLENGKVVKSTSTQYDEQYPISQYNYWTYNVDNTLSTVVNKDDFAGTRLANTFAEGNLQGMTFGNEFTYVSDKSLRAVPATIDVRYLINLVVELFSDEDVVLGNLLSTNAYSSQYLPNKVQFAYDYTEDGENFETRTADINLNTTFVTNVLTLDFSESNLPAVGFYGNKIVVTYEDVK